MTERTMMPRLPVLLVGLLYATLAAGKPAVDMEHIWGQGLGVVSKFDATDLAVVAGLCGGTFSWCKKPEADGRCPAEAKVRSPGARPMCVIPNLCDDREYPIIVHRVYRGGFSSAKASEALVDFTNPCAAHTGNWGGYALLRRSGGAWKPVTTDATKRVLQHCVVYAGRPPAGQFLACGYESAWLGEGGIVSWELALHRVKNDKLQDESLLFLCHKQPPVCEPGGEVFWYAPWNPTLDTRDITGDGRPDLGVHITVGHLVVPPVGCANDLADASTWAKSDQREAVTVAFENSGTGLQATAAGKRSMARIETILGLHRCD